MQDGGVFCRTEKCGINSLIEILLSYVSSFLLQVLKELCAVVARLSLWWHIFRRGGIVAALLLP